MLLNGTTARRPLREAPHVTPHKEGAGLGPSAMTNGYSLAQGEDNPACAARAAASHSNCLVYHGPDDEEANPSHSYEHDGRPPVPFSRQDNPPSTRHLPSPHADGTAPGSLGPSPSPPSDGLKPSRAVR